MGCGFGSKRTRVSADFLPGPESTSHSGLQYSRTVSLHATKQGTDGRSPFTVQITFPVTEAMLTLSKRMPLQNREFWVSACVLPGMDPHMTSEKQCQDMCFFQCDGESFICGAFDGHGSNGRDVSHFCAKTVEQFYLANKEKYLVDPAEFLEAVTKKVDSDLKLSATGIDSSGSGSTEVLLLLLDDTIHIAGVGDSRGILGSLDPPADPPAVPRPLRGEGKQTRERLRSRRALSLRTPIQSVQLTKDQKPEDTEELIRIFKCGGRVMQMTDEKGNKVGPYRVWKPNTNGPGIAMSRSIGDTVGTDLGVISDPVLTQYQMNWESDLFMICASDGIWDVMDNDEVVRFIEQYRYHCVRGAATPPSGEPVTCGNATIAQLICEEARARWFTIVEKEEVFIDDISCVIVEFKDWEGDEEISDRSAQATTSPRKHYGNTKSSEDGNRTRRD